MIAQIRGKLVIKSPGQVVVEVGGVGYQVFIPLSTYYQLPEVGKEVLLYTSTHLREDALLLYGFLTLEEKAIFELLRSVSGIGPRLATNILSGISVEELAPAISQGNLHRLHAIPGVGKKTAERMVLELREKVVEIPIPSPSTPLPPALEREGLQEDMISALINLGYKRALAAQAVARALKELPDGAGFEKLIKHSLRLLSEAA
ncbi:MAG: Holliday junction branch migration protein RuvA [candidate division NC10 bacterium]|nr:Holliday junction branch migration protein RuvA [candidate division NC10 bacterium]